MSEKMGKVGILNVGAGDTKLSFDPSDPAECIRAARIVKDMIRRGYALLVDTGQKDSAGRPKYTRAYDFDETKHEYIIADLDPIVSKDDEATHEQTATQSGSAPTPKGRPHGRKGVSATAVNVIAVAPSAGG